MHQRQAADRLDAHQHDGLVARDAQAPQLALVYRAGQGAGAWCAVQQRRGQVLQRQVFLGCQGQVAQPHLSQRGSHAGGALDMGGLQVFVDARCQLFFGGGGGGGKGQPGHRARRQAKLDAQAGYRVQAIDWLTLGVQGLGEQRWLVGWPVAPGKHAPVGNAVYF